MQKRSVQRGQLSERAHCFKGPFCIPSLMDAITVDPDACPAHARGRHDVPPIPFGDVDMPGLLQAKTFLRQLKETQIWLVAACLIRLQCRVEQMVKLCQMGLDERGRGIAHERQLPAVLSAGRTSAKGAKWRCS